MHLQRLRYFVGVAESLNFTKAARGLHVTVPALSRQIRQLEEELEVQLFQRNRRRVILTAIGNILLQQARGLLAQAAEIEQNLRLAHKGVVGTVKVGVGPGVEAKLSRLMLEHAQQFPSVEVQCHEILSEQQPAALQSREIDIGFLRTPVAAADLCSQYLFDERLVVLLNRESWLAKGQPAHLCVKDLAQESLVLHDRNSSSILYDKILDLYRQAGVKPRVVHQGTLLHYPIFVASGKGVAIAAESVYTGTDNKVVMIPLDDPAAQLPISIAWRRDESSAAVLALLDAAQKVFAPGANEAPPQEPEAEICVKACNGA
jgi:DNA-binding transcriptional LysR family regulator